NGDAYCLEGKGLSRGRDIIKASFEERPNEIIAGNDSFYGEPDGNAYTNDTAGERFRIRHSGAGVVVEG
ncbi:GltB/FmdC/FwdC-like GXGXG domain-containing protein, partial [Staphylococcus aureus]